MNQNQLLAMFGLFIIAACHANMPPANLNDPAFLLIFGASVIASYVVAFRLVK